MKKLRKKFSLCLILPPKHILDHQIAARSQRTEEHETDEDFRFARFGLLQRPRSRFDHRQTGGLLLWKNIEFYTTEFQHLEKAGAGFFAF